MGYDDNYSPFTVMVARPQRTRTSLWRMTKEARTVEASLLVSDDGTVEVQVFTDGEIFQGRRCASRTAAQQYAAKLFEAHRQRGWLPVVDR